MSSERLCTKALMVVLQLFGCLTTGFPFTMTLKTLLRHCHGYSVIQNAGSVHVSYFFSDWYAQDILLTFGLSYYSVYWMNCAVPMFLFLTFRKFTSLAKRRLTRLEDCYPLKVSIGYITNPCLKTEKKVRKENS